MNKDLLDRVEKLRKELCEPGQVAVRKRSEYNNLLNEVKDYIERSWDFQIPIVIDEKFTFFWAGPFSQWATSVFKIDGVTYSSAEQYMMAEKARFFGDEETVKKIMQTAIPYEQKKLGRQVKNFNKNKWKAVARDVVYKGNVAKFSQNPHLKEKLMETKGTTLVEASPHDELWGIGLREDDPRAQNRSQWQGRNWLGEVITKVREKFIELE